MNIVDFIVRKVRSITTSGLFHRSRRQERFGRQVITTKDVPNVLPFQRNVEGIHEPLERIENTYMNAKELKRLKRRDRKEIEHEKALQSAGPVSFKVGKAGPHDEVDDEPEFDGLEDFIERTKIKR